MASLKSSILLALQLSLIGLIFLSAGIFTDSKYLLIPQLTGFLLGIWAALILYQKSKFNAFAEVRKGADLVSSGPYKYIRNPIYTSIYLFQIPLVLEDLNVINLSLLLLLALVLHLKIQLEEKYLTETFTDYKKYKSKTWRLLPYIY